MIGVLRKSVYNFGLSSSKTPCPLGVKVTLKGIYQLYV